MTAPDSPAVAAVRAMVATLRRRGPSRGADALDGALAELDEARRRLRELETRVPSGFLGALDAVEQSELLAEWRCPGCGATTRARMADRVLDERGFVDLDATYRTGSPASDRLVAECERRRLATGDPTTPQPEEAS